MIFFVFLAVVIATILFAIVIEKLLRSPLLVSVAFFSIYLIILAILYTVGVVTDLSIWFIVVIALTVIAYISAIVTRFVKCICRKFLGECCSICPTRYDDDDIEPEYECNRSSLDEKKKKM